MHPAKLGVRLQTDPAGCLESQGRPDPVLVIHVGRPVEIACERAGQGHFGLSVHGDLDIIPAGVGSRWTLKQQDEALVIRVGQELLREAAAGLSLKASDAVLRNRFQIRDSVIEHLGWALRNEMEHGFPSGELFTDGIGMAIASRLLLGHGQVPLERAQKQHDSLSGSRLRRVLAYIEENLGEDLSLEAIAAVAELSASHLQRAFGRAVGTPVHQYVIRRRVERARSLLADRRLALSEVALQAGFSHQSHLAYHMRRALGVTPTELRQAELREELE